MNKFSPVHIYTDGSCNYAGKRECGVGVYMSTTYKGKEYSKKYSKVIRSASTSNMAELAAIRYALDILHPTTRDVIIYSDSQYAVKVLTGQAKFHKNKELIYETQRLVKLHGATLIHIPRKENTVANSMARKAMMNAKHNGKNTDD